MRRRTQIQISKVESLQVTRCLQEIHAKNSIVLRRGGTVSNDWVCNENTL
jgi:hypothetical protein